MGQQKRYAAQSAALLDKQFEAMRERPRPVQLPQQAFGPEPIRWVQEAGTQPRVWAWVPWTDGRTRRMPAVALGWNDRCVDVLLDSGRRVIVWRAAVTHRA